MDHSWRIERIRQFSEWAFQRVVFAPGVNLSKLIVEEVVKRAMLDWTRRTRRDGRSRRRQDGSCDLLGAMEATSIAAGFVGSTIPTWTMRNDLAHR